MAQGKDAVTERPNGPGRSREIADDIDRTRTALDRTVDAIVGKLTPQQLALEAVGVLRSGSTSIAAKFVDTAREHPVPATIVSLGLGMLLWERSASAGAAEGGSRVVGRAQEKADDAGEFVTEKLEPVREKIEQVSGSIQETAQQAKRVAREKLHDVKEEATQLKAQARQQVRRAKTGFQRNFDEQPLVLGGIAVALGAAAALLIPHTRREDDVMGETRDRLLEDAEEAGKKVIEKGRHVARTAVETVRQEAQKQGVTPGDLAEKVRTMGREVENAAKQDAERQHLMPEPSSGAQPSGGPKGTPGTQPGGTAPEAGMPPAPDRGHNWP